MIWCVPLPKNWCLQQFLSPKPCFLAKKKCLGPLRQAKRIDSLFILLFLNHCYFQLFHAFMLYQGHFLNLHFSQVRSVISADIVRARLLAQVFSYHFHCFHFIILVKMYSKSPMGSFFFILSKIRKLGS